MLKIYETKPDSIQKEFEDPVEMAKRARNIIDRDIKRIISVDPDGYFDYVNLPYEPNIKIHLSSAHENGVIYSITCFPDQLAGKYDTYTSAILVCIKGKDPEFIINCPNDKYEELKKELGPRIDEEFIEAAKVSNIGKKKQTFRNKKKEELQKLKIELLSKKIELLVKNSIIDLFKIEEKQKKCK